MLVRAFVTMSHELTLVVDVNPCSRIGFFIHGFLQKSEADAGNPHSVSN
jgi:hypothetical protein